MPAISSTAARNAPSLAFDGLLKPLIFLTNWSEAARISSGVTGGSKLKRGLMFLHMHDHLDDEIDIGFDAGNAARRNAIPLNARASHTLVHWFPFKLCGSAIALGM
jgi:hypothetical protein